MSLGTNPRIWFVWILVTIAGCMLGAPAVQAQPDAAGTWTAKIPGPQGEIELTLVLEKDGEAWRGTLRGARRTVEVDQLTVVGDQVHFSTTNPEVNVTANWDGTLDPAGNRLVMTSSVPGMGSQEIGFIRQIDQIIDESGGKKYRVGSGPAGVWVGQVKAPDGEDSQVRLVLDKETNDWTASIEDPFVNAVRGENVKVTDTLISFTYRPEGAPFPSHFSGTYIAADDRVTGSFSQRGSSRFVKFQRDPDTVTLGLGPDGQPIQPPRVRHAHRFALTGRMSQWAALHVVKDEVDNLNTLTKSALNYDGALKFYPLDDFCLFVRVFHGGQGFTDDAERLAPFADLGLSGDSYLKLDGYEFGLMGYLGNLVTPNSAFNPYVTAALGTADWELTTGDRGSAVISLEDEPFTGSDLSTAIGLGTEYELNASMFLELEFLWRYFLTEDTVRWPEPDTSWSNTHAWGLSFGLTYGFF